MPQKRIRVVVAGAGLAGLVAARYLERAGAAVTIVEARDRIGGRVLTRREGFEAGQHAELGADLIEAEQEDVLALARELNLKTVRILRGGWGFHGGKRRTVERRSAPDMFERLATLLEPEIKAHQAADNRWDSAVAQTLGRESAAEWLQRVRADAELTAAIRGLRGFYLADPEDISLLPLVDQFTEGETPGASRMYRLHAGNDALPAAIARQLKAIIILGTPVRRVVRRGRSLQVALGGRSQEQLTADYFVSTLPATTLRRVVFEPALPAEQSRAIATLRYGPATKILLQFEKRFWSRLVGPSAYGSDLPTGAVWDANEQQSRSPGILTLLAGGRASREVQAIITCDDTWPPDPRCATSFTSPLSGQSRSSSRRSPLALKRVRPGSIASTSIVPRRCCHR